MSFNPHSVAAFAEPRARPAAGADDLRLRHRRLVAPRLPPRRARRARRRGADRRGLRLPRPQGPRQSRGRPAQGARACRSSPGRCGAPGRRPRRGASPTTSPSRATAPPCPVDARRKFAHVIAVGRKAWTALRASRSACSAGSTRSRPPNGTPAPARCRGRAPADPFTTHRFLRALETSGSVGRGSGWTPRHLVARIGGSAIAVMPLYAKGHSQGEYVFDHNWAHAWERAGGSYYPKLQARGALHPGDRAAVPDPARARGDGPRRPARRGR